MSLLFFDVQARRHPLGSKKWHLQNLCHYVSACVLDQIAAKTNNNLSLIKLSQQMSDYGIGRNLIQTTV